MPKMIRSINVYLFVSAAAFTLQQVGEADGPPLALISYLFSDTRVKVSLRNTDGQKNSNR
jgi:hypothetical protein